MEAAFDRGRRLQDEAERLTKTIEAAWIMIENGWAENIESRVEWEKRFPGQALEMAIHAAGFKRDTKAETEVMELRHYRCEQDCRYTMGNVADIGGRHCPLGKPCERCKNEDRIEALESAIRDGACHLKQVLCVKG